MSNNRTSGGYFSKDADKLIYSSDKSGIFNIYEVDLKPMKKSVNRLKRGVIFCKRLLANYW